MTQENLNFESAHDQASMILNYLMSGQTLTSLDALRKFGCFRLGARVWDLKKRGYNIVAKNVTLPSGKRVAEYRYEQV